MIASTRSRMRKARVSRRPTVLMRALLAARGRSRRSARRTPARSAGRATRGYSKGTWNSPTIRPGRALITRMRVDRNTASLIECVMNSPAKPLAHEQRDHLVVQAFAGDLVDRTERLVEQEHLRVEHEAAGQRGAHLHAARQLLRVLLLVSRPARRGRCSPRRASATSRPSTGPRVRRAARRCRMHRAPLQQRGVLEDVAEARRARP